MPASERSGAESIGRWRVHQPASKFVGGGTKRRRKKPLDPGHWPLCLVLGYRWDCGRSPSILQALTAALADHTLPQLLRYYAKFDLVILDEFGFDRVERIEIAPMPRACYTS